MQPKSIKMFQVFAWISLGLSALIVLLLLVAGGIFVSAVGGGGLFAVFMLVAVASLVGMGFLIHLAAKKRSNVARWIYVVLGGLGVLFGLLGMFGPNSNAGGILMMLVLCGVQGAALVFLLMPDSAAWFAGHQGYGGYPPQHGAGYPPQHGGGYPPQPGAGYPPQQGGGYPPQPGQLHGGGYPPQQGGDYPPQPQQGGYPPQQGAGGYPPQQGHPQQGQPQQGGYPPQQGGGYPPQQGGGYPPASGGGGYPPQ
jgi:hypothetical protein